jgi:hypothetical protein
MTDEELNASLARITGTNGAELLDEMRDAYIRYVVLPSRHAVVAVVLWTVATHGLRAFEHATRLAIHSAVKKCGKSRLLEIIEALAHDPLATTNISVAALFRVVEKAGDRPPTLILDEADRIFGSAKKDDDNRDLIGLLNNGFRGGSPTWRCVGPQQTPTAFSNYAMAAIAGIGRKPDTIEDRAVNITMRRRLPGETVAKFRLKTDPARMHELRDRVAVWVAAVMTQLEQPVTDLPLELEDRAEDAWEPLLAVADAAGGDWPRLAREAALSLSAQADDDDNSLEIRLLRDIEAIFEAMPHVSFLATEVLIGELKRIDDAPWADIDLTGRKLAMRLASFEVKPGKDVTRTTRGYHREDFIDTFQRYARRGGVPTRPEPSSPANTGGTAGRVADGSGRVNGHMSATRPDTAQQTSAVDGSGRFRTGTPRAADLWPPEDWHNYAIEPDHEDAS